MRRLAALLVAAALPLAGCLTNTYRIPPAELARLAQTPPEQRGNQVRVVQDLTTSDSPAPAAPVTAETHVSAVVVVPIRIGGPRPRTGPPYGGGYGGGPSPVRDTGGLAKSKADEAWVWFVLAGVVAIGLAATEGARYDGWVQLHPMHPVHLFGPGGYTVVPLAQIDPNTAAWAERAVVRDSEGPWRMLGRAPLDRAGWSYSVLGGAASVPSADGTTELGAAAHIQIGYYPSHSIGIVGDVGLSWRPNMDDQTIYDSRWGLELHYLPLDAGPFHGGVFGGLALGARLEDIGDRTVRKQGLVVGGGALLQLEITTRLALTGRFGLGDAYGEASRDITVGLSVY